MKQKKKTKQIHIRLTEEQDKLLRSKALNYTSLTDFLIDAALAFNEKKGRRGIDTMIEFSTYYEEYRTDISRIGNNINQIAHTLHIMKKNNKVIDSSCFIEEVQKAKETLENLLVEHKKLARKTKRLD